MSPLSRLLLGGFLTLAVVMGVGRFYYTPLLPIMRAEHGFGVDTAGLIAGFNFAGYLLGSLLVTLVSGAAMRLATFRLGLVLSVATTLAMGFTENLPLWYALRALSGIASALAMISAAGIIAEALARIGQEARIGWVFGGVGSGIAASGLLVHLAEPHLSAASLWIAAGLGCAALLPVMLAFVGDRDLQAFARTHPHTKRIPRPLPFWPLFASYTAEGLGYSVFATFIVAIVKSRPGLEDIGSWVWIIVGLAGLPSCLFWSALAERIGFSLALLLAFLTQILGIPLPVMSDSGTAALAAAVLFGGTFIPITLLTMPLGRKGLNGRGFAVLTAGFGLGQMLGPVATGWLVEGPADYDTALLASAGVVTAGAAMLAVAMARREGVA
ncbi:MFS transporter [Aureimonas sp. SA4125]|uniref:YbfB/YjiJ family MFS transporter n=1 Tax=Aureimonas sp. SA4125 TaxID=2826993 RepID=UPI001CC69AAC|nr:YbfB/YjiJ family MFS transporter [Aureimonas sp. SA4125]BDA86398.1 MFS transporter [Aureimonas sp. SA4125]